jgi:signal transduction histidine kinase
LNTLVESSQIQRALFHETLDRYRDLDLLYKAGETIASSLDLATVNRLLLDESIRITQADEGAVMLWEQVDQQLTVWASRGLDAVQDIGPGVPLGYEGAKKVIHSGQTKIIEQPALGRRQRPLATLLCIPLRTKDEVQGVISLAYTSPENHFEPSAVKLLNALAGQASVAIDNAKMFSDLIKLHTELESANRRLLELDQLKSSFLGVITHELRSPFANIDFSLQLIERYGTETWPPEQQEQWQQLTRLTNEAQVMIDHLVSFAGLLIKRGDLYWTGVDFAGLVQEVVNTLMPTALSRQVDMQIEPADKLPLVVGDKMRLAEAIHHLIHNAIKFNHVGGTVRVHYWLKDNKLTFQVQDSGIGIPDEKLELLWNSFSQVADPLKRGVEGLGLGLAMVKYVVNAHGGEVNVSSQEGGGSTFSFWLPVKQP